MSARMIPGQSTGFASPGSIMQSQKSREQNMMNRQQQSIGPSQTPGWIKQGSTMQQAPPGMRTSLGNKIGDQGGGGGMWNKFGKAGQNGVFGQGPMGVPGGGWNGGQTDMGGGGWNRGRGPVATNFPMRPGMGGMQDKIRQMMEYGQGMQGPQPQGQLQGTPNPEGVTPEALPQGQPMPQPEGMGPSPDVIQELMQRMGGNRGYGGGMRNRFGMPRSI